MEEKEIAILSLLRNRNYYDRYRHVIDREYFTNDYTREAFDSIGRFFVKYPDVAMVSKRNMRLMVEATGEDKKLMIELIRQLVKRDKDTPIIEDQIRSFVKDGIARNVLRQNIPALEGRGNFNIDDMIQQLELAKDINIVGNQLYDYCSETDSLHQSYEDRGVAISTGFEDLDDVLRWPPTTGEEWIIMGPPGRGKTQWMLNMAVSTASKGKKVLYVTVGDQGRNQIRGRIDEIVSGIPGNKLRDPTSRIMGMVRRRVRETIMSVGGAIYIQDWSETSCTPRQIDNLINMMDVDLDVLLVDYGDIMLSNDRYIDRRHELASIFKDLRRICIRHQVLGWVGSQANRAALDKKVITMKDVAEDIQKCWVADGIFTFCQTPEEKEEDIGRIYIPKARRPGLKKYEWNFTIDSSNGRIMSYV